MTTLPFSRFEIAQFRGLRGLTLEGLGRINLLVGQNNCGKTSVLEALTLCLAPMDPLTWIETAHTRVPGGASPRRTVERLRWLFPQTAERESGQLFSGMVELRLQGFGTLITRLRATYEELRGTPGGEITADELPEAEPAMVPSASDGPSNLRRRGATIEISVDPTGPFFDSSTRSFTVWQGERFVSKGRSGLGLPSVSLTPYDHWLRSWPAYSFSEARRGGFDVAVAELVQLLDERVSGIEVLTSQDPDHRDEAVLYLRDRFAGLLPVDAFGDGFRRALLMALAIPRAAGGVLLIDEIETAIHVSALDKVFGWMVRACHQHNVQLFVTTHSLEAIDAILGADPTPEEDIVSFRLQREGEETKARRFGEDLLKRLRYERGLEVR